MAEPDEWHTDWDHDLEVDPATTQWGLIEGRVARSPDREMVVDEHVRRLTFEQYRDWCLRVAAGLATSGVGPGTVVSWQLPTRLETLVLMGALARLGAFQVPLLPIYGQREITFITEQVGTELFISAGTRQGVDQAAMAKTALRSTGGELLIADPVLPEAEGQPAIPEPTDPDETRFAFYTSGTTGEPKGARHTDRSVIAASIAMAVGQGITEADRQALVFPIAHVGGPICLNAGFLTGCANVIAESFDPATTPDHLSRQGITLGGSGTAFHQVYLARQAEQPDAPLFPDIRSFPGGAAPKPPGLHATMVEVFGAGIVSAYGMTEAPILTSNHPSFPDDMLARTEGRATPGVRMRVVDGELRVKGPQMFQGYVDRTLDAEAFDEDGWLRTGDLAVIHDGGFLEITGRLKDVIIRKGENISAKEIEDLLHQHPSVAEAAVVGLPDEETGERACAVVVVAPDAEPFGFEDMTRHLRDAGLMIQKIPEQLEHVNELPRTATGKVLKSLLIDDLAGTGRS